MNILFRSILLYLMLVEGLSAGLGTEPVPHVNQKAQESFQFDYTYADMHRAFAIAPGGAWAWNSGSPTVEDATRAALESCGRYTEQKCVIYAVNNEIVFDAQKWSGLWGPYKNKKQASQSETGNKLGQKFPDLIFTDPGGVKKSISDIKGKVAFVHLWGCWCPPCRKEFETLIDMYRIVKDLMGEQVQFVVLQLREPISQAREWAQKNSLTALPLSDSGVENSEDKFLTVKSGEKIPDRQLAHVFPASYVIDKHGIVVFSHMGSIDDWSVYVPFFMDVVKRSGK